MLGNIYLSLVKAGIRTAITLKKHEPLLLMIIGGASGVLALRAASEAGVKCKEIKDQLEKDIEYSKDLEQRAKDAGIEEKYTAEDGENDRKILKRRAKIEMVKAWSKAFLYAIASGLCFARAYRLMRTAYLGLKEAYMGLKKEKIGLEKALIPFIGEEGLRRLHEGQSIEVEKAVTNESGDISTEKVTVEPVNEAGVYRLRFAKGHPAWENDPVANHRWLYQKQKWAEGYLKLHEDVPVNVFIEALGFKPTRKGQTDLVLYRQDPREVERLGIHNSIDFGIFRSDITDPETIAFRDQKGTDVWITIRTDGPVFDPVKWPEKECIPKEIR